MKDIIERIKKLMALADLSRGATEAEAAAAMAKVQELLTKHNLDMASIRTEDKPEMTSERKTYEWNANWIAPMAARIAELYFCMAVSEKNGTVDQKIELFGLPVNVMAAQYVIDVCVGAAKRGAREYANIVKKETGLEGQKQNSFLIGGK